MAQFRLIIFVVLTLWSLTSSKQTHSQTDLKIIATLPGYFNKLEWRSDSKAFMFLGTQYLDAVKTQEHKIELSVINEKLVFQNLASFALTPQMAGKFRLSTEEKRVFDTYQHIINNNSLDTTDQVTSNQLISPDGRYVVFRKNERIPNLGGSVMIGDRQTMSIKQLPAYTIWTPKVIWSENSSFFILITQFGTDVSSRISGYVHLDYGLQKALLMPLESAGELARLGDVSYKIYYGNQHTISGWNIMPIYDLSQNNQYILLPATVSLEGNHTVLRKDINNLSDIMDLSINADHILHAAFVPGRVDRFYFATKLGLAIYDISTKKITPLPSQFPSNWLIDEASFSPDGRWFAMIVRPNNPDQQIYLYSLFSEVLNTCEKNLADSRSIITDYQSGKFEQVMIQLKTLPVSSCQEELLALANVQR
jgi:hypothetical protein